MLPLLLVGTMLGGVPAIAIAQRPAPATPVDLNAAQLLQRHGLAFELQGVLMSDQAFALLDDVRVVRARQDQLILSPAQ